MRYDKLTLKAQEALQQADSTAHALNHPALDPEHLLLALVEQKDGVVPPLLERIGADPGAPATFVSSEHYQQLWLARMAHYGRLIGKAWGEPFRIRGYLEVTDLVAAFGGRML